jgi:hypothetical protein
MHAEMEALLALQHRDRQLLELERDWERIPRDEERARGRLDGDQRALEQARDALRAAEMAIKSVELDAGTRRTTVTRLRQQQFETRKNEEYQAIAHEIARYTADVDQLETRELELMEEADRCRERQVAAEQALAATRRMVEEEMAELGARRQELEARRAGWLAERRQLVQAVPGEVLPLYERLLKTKNGLAVVPVQAGGQCGGCHMKLIPATLVRLQAASGIVQCENCGRILRPEQ